MRYKHTKRGLRKKKSFPIHALYYCALIVKTEQKMLPAILMENLCSLTLPPYLKQQSNCIMEIFHNGECLSILLFYCGMMIKWKVKSIFISVYLWAKKKIRNFLEFNQQVYLYFHMKTVPLETIRLLF